MQGEGSWTLQPFLTGMMGQFLPRNAAWPTMHWHIDKKPTFLSVGGIMEVYTA